MDEDRKLPKDQLNKLFAWLRDKEIELKCPQCHELLIGEIYWSRTMVTMLFTTCANCGTIQLMDGDFIGLELGDDEFEEDEVDDASDFDGE